MGKQAFRKLFHWKHSNWPTGILLPLGVGLALSHQYSFAYFCFAVGAIWASLAWIASDSLERKRPKTKKATKSNPSPRPPTPKQFRSYRMWRAVPVFGIFVFLLLICTWTRRLQIDYELESYDGWLYPDSESLTSPCKEEFHPGDLQIMVGSNAYLQRGLPHNVIMAGCDRLLRVDRDNSGRVGISLSLFDDSGKIVTQIEDGHFVVNRNNVFKIDRKGSRSTLYVFDQRGNEALYMHLANRNVLQLRANFYHKGIHIVLDEYHPMGAPSMMSNSCLGLNAFTDVMLGDCLVR